MSRAKEIIELSEYLVGGFSPYYRGGHYQNVGSKFSSKEKALLKLFAQDYHASVKYSSYMDSLIDQGYLKKKDGKVTITPEGRVVAMQVSRERELDHNPYYYGYGFYPYGYRSVLGRLPHGKHTGSHDGATNNPDGSAPNVPSGGAGSQTGAGTGGGSQDGTGGGTGTPSGGTTP